MPLLTISGGGERTGAAASAAGGGGVGRQRLSDSSFVGRIPAALPTRPLSNFFWALPPRSQGNPGRLSRLKIF
jgi:hypothetical protein